MSRPPAFDDAELAAALGARQPATFDRAGRVKLIGEAAQALIAGRLPGREAALFVGGALLAWLENGGDLSREFFRVTKRHSHHTPDVLWRLIADERQLPEDAVTIAASSPESEYEK